MTIPSDIVEGSADFTRWNRAGLDRFRYMGHGAAEFTEMLRIAHLLLYGRRQIPTEIDPPEHWRQAFETGTFPDDTDLEIKIGDLQSVYPRQDMYGITSERATYREKLSAQYQARSTDPSAQIARAFARAMHIVSETLDAYANEGTLRTATQSQHALNLLSLIGFRPSPASSAVTPLAYQLKPDQDRVNIPEGTAFEYVLPEGAGNLTFEALEAVTTHSSLNEMLPEGHDSRVDPIDPQWTRFFLVEKSTFSNDIAGTIAMIQDGDEVEAVRVESVDDEAMSVHLLRSEDHPIHGKLQTAEFLTAPRETWSARPRSSWIHFEDTPQTYPSAVVQVLYDDNTYEYFRVAETRGRDIRLTQLGRLLLNLNEALTGMGLGPSTSLTILAVYATEAGNKDPEFENGDTVDTVSIGLGLNVDVFEINNLYLKRGDPIGTLDAGLNPDRIYVEGAAPVDFKDYQALVFEMADGTAVAGSFTSKQEDEYCTSIKAEDVTVSHSSVVMIHAGFSSNSRFVADTKSKLPLVKPDGTIAVVCPTDEQDLLRPGRRLILAKTDQSKACEGTVSEVADTLDETVFLRVDTGGADLADFTEGGTVVHGNAAVFGHGKTLPARVLGSGDAGQVGQTIELEEEDVSTRLNPEFPGGVAPDIQVSIEGRLWQQVSPDMAGASDGPTFSVIQQSDGSSAVRFHQLLPTGSDNVLLTRIRTGAGAIGNEIPAFGVTNLQPKNSAVEAIVQPLAPQAGADRQGVEELRSRGKSRYALFGRALSVTDFARLAESHVGVVHAGAELIRQGTGRGGNNIRLTVVPAGGSDLSLIDDQLESLLLDASLPGTTLIIEPFNPAPVSGACMVRLLPGYADVQTIRGELGAALMNRFELDARPLGVVLYASELAAVIEEHAAVDFVTVAIDAICGADTGISCELTIDGSVQALRPDSRTAVYLKTPADFRVEFLGGGS